MAETPRIDREENPIRGGGVLYENVELPTVTCDRPLEILRLPGDIDLDLVDSAASRDANNATSPSQLDTGPSVSYLILDIQQKGQCRWVEIH